MKQSSFTETEYLIFNLAEATNWNLLPSELSTMYADDFSQISEYVEVRQELDSFNPFSNHDLKDFLVDLFEQAFGG